MKNLDNNLREIFSNKLANHESHVRPELWNAVQAKLAAQVVGASSAAASAAKFGISNLWWAAASIVGIGGSIVLGVALHSNNQEVEKPAMNTPAMTQPLPNEHAPDVAENEETKSTNYRHTIYTEPNAISVEEIGHQQVGDPIVDLNIAKNGSETNDNQNGKPLMDNTERLDELVDNATTTQQQVADNATQTSISFKAVTVSEKDLRFFFIPAVEGVDYAWNFGDGNASDQMSPAHNYDEQGTYMVTLTTTDDSGVEQTITNEVQAFKPADLFITNILTPNGDGKNEYFHVEVKENTAVLNRIVVMNSNAIIFDSDGSQLWYGNLANGEPAPAGQYTYLIRATDRNQRLIEKTGSLTLDRD
ncbi:MAG: PKD domain-containing protein [Flavobacteriales bacterium]